ncbi:MAG: hypothetical protein RLZZ200_534 [Pseudomonadota bacterium]|jgi:type III pantothenate kinase
MNTMLLIDIGNTRLKWAVLRGRKAGRQHALDLPARGLPDLSALLKAGARASHVLVSSVAGPQRDRALARQLRAVGLPSPQFVASTPEAAGVTNGYRDPWRLGVDRWVAVIGAWHVAGRRAVCVVDIGTATTVDVVDARGRHQGGLIVPGPVLMTSSLLSGTQGIAPRASGRQKAAKSGLGRDTATALQRGACVATAALVERAARDARREHGADCAVFVTGGGAAEVLSLLDIDVRRCPDLVLRGLAVLAV